MFSSVFAISSVALEERGRDCRKAGVSELPIVFRYLVMTNPIPNIGLSIAYGRHEKIMNIWEYIMCPVYSCFNVYLFIFSSSSVVSMTIWNN